MGHLLGHLLGLRVHGLLRRWELLLRLRLLGHEHGRLHRLHWLLLCGIHGAWSHRLARLRGKEAGLRLWLRLHRLRLGGLAQQTAVVHAVPVEA